MTLPLVSVIMPAFNEEAYIAASIQSILNQTYQNIELIIIDDYSTDRTRDICLSFTDPRVRYYKKKSEAKYPASSRNLGVVLSKGEYVVFQDADDYSSPNRIELQLQCALQNAGNRIVGCGIARVEGNVERVVVYPTAHTDIVSGFTRTYNRTTIVSGLIMAPRKLLLETKYNETLRYFEDWDLVVRLYETGKVEFSNCPQVLYKYFIRSKGVIYQDGWINDNLYVRYCQYCRSKGLPVTLSAQDFVQDLISRPFQNYKWFFLKQMILLKRFIYLNYIAVLRR